MTETAAKPGADTAARPPTPATPAPPGPDAQEADPRRWIALGIVLTAAFMALLDISIVNVAIPSIQNNLGASFGEVQLVIALYGLAYAVVLITGGRLGDIYGRKRLFMVGMAGFTVASALCGFAVNPVMLVASRGLQGTMAALMFPQVLSVIQVSFPPRERAGAFGLFGAIIGLATILGPLAGGLIIRDDVTGQAWRFVFLVNLPVGIASLLAARALLHESKAPDAPRLDLAGVGVVTLGLLLLVWPLVEGRDAGWPLWSYVCLGLSPFVLAAFVVVERIKTKRDTSPLVPVTLFQNRSFKVGLLISFVFLSGIPAFFLTFSLFLQIGLGFSALRAGLTTIPFSVASAIASGLSVRLAPKLGKGILLIGSVLICAGVAGVIVTVHLRGTDLNGFELIPTLLVAGFGMGCIIAPLVNVILAGLPWQQAGASSGVLTTFQQVGGAVGVAVIGVIFFGFIGHQAPGSADAVTPRLEAQLTAAQPGAPRATIEGELRSFSHCFVERAQSNDPSQAPPDCVQSGPSSSGAVGAAFQGAAKEALGQDFGVSLERALLFVVAVFAATGLLVLLLPSRRPGGPSAMPTAH